VSLLHQHFTFIDPLRRGDRKLLFFSYSHKDKTWLEEVRRHFAFVPSHEITLWDDSLIRPGQAWDSEILHTIIRCRAAILIVTPNFLNSTYIRKHELPFLLNQRRHKQLELFWLLAEQVDIKETGLDEVRAGNDIGESLTQLALNPARLNEILVKFATGVVGYLRGQ
jgi:hypothetical protein